MSANPFSEQNLDYNFKTLNSSLEFSPDCVQLLFVLALLCDDLQCHCRSRRPIGGPEKLRITKTISLGGGNSEFWPDIELKAKAFCELS